MTINNELLAKFEGKWKEWKLSDLVDGLYNVDYDSLNPSYSTSPDDRERLWGYLMGKEEMWEEFFWWCWNSSPKEAQDLRDRFVAWLTLPLDGVPRWLHFLSEWLGMESTRERFGWVECHGCDGKNSVPIECSEGNKECGGSGKICAEWIKEA